MEMLVLDNITKNFTQTSMSFGKKHLIRALQGVDLVIPRGKTLGLVGESGSGKSTLGRCLLKLIDPTSGEIYFNGERITAYSPSKMKSLRRKMQIIFQDPYGSLNPRRTVGEILEEPLVIHSLKRTQKERNDRVAELLGLVGLPEDVADRFPHEFSGGQRQRVGIARALAVEPELIVCDEPVSALDVSIQAQILNLLIELQKKLGLTYLFISHDLRVVRHLSHMVSVMYLGKVVEVAPTETLFSKPSHPYTEALLSSVPHLDPLLRKTRILLKGEPPSPISPPSGCQFHPRCPKAEARCAQFIPPLKPMKNDEKHEVSCLLVE